MYVVYVNVYCKIPWYFRTLCYTVCNYRYLWYKKLISWCVMLTQSISHFVDCFFERCFYSCTVFSRYFVGSSSCCWRGQNFAQYVYPRHPANVLTLWPSEVSWRSMWMHKYNFVVVMFIRHWAHRSNPPESVTQTANIATRSRRRHCLYSTVTAAVHIVGFSSRNSANLQSICTGDKGMKEWKE